MYVVVNNEKVSTEASTVSELLLETVGTTQTSGIAIAVDATVVPRSQWEQPLVEGSVIDILTAVQGG